MAFIKMCVGTVLKCACGKPGVLNHKGKWYCLNCSEKYLKKTKNN